MQLLHSRGRYSDRRTEEIRAGRREFKREQASALAKASMAELERRELGETRRAGITEAGFKERLGMKEVGLGERLGRKQEFARPVQTAEAGRLEARAGLREAEAEKVSYGTEVARGLEETIKGTVRAKGRYGEAKAKEQELGVQEYLRGMRLRDEEEKRIEAARPSGIEAPAAPARPVGRAKSLIERILGYTLPGGAAYSPMKDWLKRGREEEEFAYPGAR